MTPITLANYNVSSQLLEDQAVFSTEIAVIGEVVGRWKASHLSKEERMRRVRTLEEITAGFPWQFVDYDGHSHPVQVQWLRHQEEYSPLAATRDGAVYDHVMPPSFIKLTCSLEYSDTYVDDYLTPSEPGDDWQIPRHEVEQLIASEVSKHVAGLLLDTMLAANIARVGSLDYSRIFRFVNDEIEGIDEGIRGIPGDAIDQATERGWPTFNELSVHQVVGWLYRVPQFLNRDTRTRLGRALAAASHILTSSWSWSALDLVWALLGLEALYTHGNLGLQQQLTEKTEVFLGQRTTHKAGVSSMYGFRSRFLHGDIDLLYAHNLHSQADRYNRIQKSMYESEFTAIAVLFATLQRMCAEDRYELNFAYEVCDSNDT